MRDARRRRCCVARAGRRRCSRNGDASHDLGIARPQRCAVVLREHDHVGGRHEHEPIWTAREDRAGRAARTRAQARERRAEHLGRLGARADGDDGPARSRGYARAAQHGRRLRAGRGAGRRQRRLRAPATRAPPAAGAPPRPRPSPVELTDAGKVAGGGLRLALARRQSAHALRDDEHHLRLDVRRPRQPHHAKRRHDYVAVRSAWLHAHDSHERRGASGEHRAEPQPVTRSAAGRTTC